jgi:NADPH2:quinone reductase
MKGANVEIDLMALMSKRLVLTGSGLRYRSSAFKAALTAEVLEKAWPWVESGAFKPVVHKVYAFDDAAEAHRTMAASTHMGKLILSWDPDH